MKNSYDVIVVGGGTAGTVAAIQAARAGASVLLVEKAGMLGGTLTMAGVNFPALFHAWGRQVIAGIGWDLVSATRAVTGQPLPDSFPDGPFWGNHIHVDASIFSALCDEAVLASGAEMLLHTMFAEVYWAGNRWKMTVCTKTGLHSTETKVLIDATGDANVVQLAGLEVVRPEPLQPGSLTMRVSGYDLDKLDIPAIEAALDRAFGDGAVKLTDIAWERSGAVRSFLKAHGTNNNHIPTGYADTSEGKGAAEVAARASLLRMFRFFRAQPGLENFRLERVASECGVRETVVIRGKKTVTGEDYLSGRMWDDAVCYSYYPVDIHRDGGERTLVVPLAKPVLPTIPRGAMLPAGSRSLVVAGRCISGDRQAHSAYRVEATCMATGQAAGAMAALAAAGNCDPEDLSIADVHRLLRTHGAIIPGDISF